MAEKQEARKAMAILKDLREEHSKTVTRTQALVKENNSLQREILKTIAEEAKTIPQIAEETGLPTPDVLWHLTAMKKYDRVIEAGMDGEYYTYRTSKEAKR
ncbi:MAG: hypothetical protein JXA97_09715 [Anaerolineales bacterium]|nr:hypothetical protein [Anaerolineales bacterium]